MGVAWCVSGGCGFIGSRLIRNLVNDSKEDVNIRVFDSLVTSDRESLSAVTSFSEISSSDIVSAPVGVELVVDDITNESSIFNATKGIDVFVHLAANTGVGPSVENPIHDCRTNVLGTLYSLEAARKNNVKKFIFASSGAPAGDIEPPIHEKIVPSPVSPYGASKLAGEGYCSAYSRCYGLDTIALRFGNVYGPGSSRKESVVAKFIRRIIDDVGIEVYGDGTQTRDYIYIDDLIDAVVKASEARDLTGEVFQIATSKETSINELIKLLNAILDNRGIVAPTVQKIRMPPGDVMRNFSDTSKAQRMLGWKSSTSLEDGLSRTVDDFLDKIGK